MQDWKRALYLISGIGILVFFNSLFNGFVYDDGQQIVSNPLVHSFGNLPYFFMGGNFFDAGTGQILSVFYRPMPSVVFTLLYPFSGGQPFLFHLFQVLLHITNAFLVYLLFGKFFKKNLAIFLSLVFLVHPINQEVVAYISDLQENLFFFFGMVALLVSSSGVASLRKIFFVNFFLLLALLSKETATLFVPILFFSMYLWHKKTLTKYSIFSLLASTAVYLYLRFFVAHVVKITDALVPIMQATLLERITTMPAIAFYYVQTFSFPVQLALGHAWVVKQITLSNFYLPLFFDCMFFVFVFFLGRLLLKTERKNFSVYLFFTCWFVLGLSLHLQIIPLDATVADRWFYFPIVGLLGIFGTFCTLPWFKRMHKDLLLIAAIVILVLLSGRTIIRNTNWTDILTLCKHDLQFVPESYNVHSVCGSELLKIGQYEEAKKQYAVAAQLAPKWGANWYFYGLSFEYTKDVPRARAYYRRSIELSKEVNAYISLAATYLKYEHDPTQAKEIIEEGIHAYPRYQRLQVYLAVCEYELHHKEKALGIASKAHQSAPSTESQYVLNQIMNNQKIVLQ